MKDKSLAEVYWKIFGVLLKKRQMVKLRARQLLAKNQIKLGIYKKNYVYLFSFMNF